MFIINKYKQPLYINFEGLGSFSVIKNINYIFTYRTKFIRNFIFFYSVFLMTNFFSPILQKNNTKFDSKLKINNLFFLNNDFNNFF